MELYSRRGRWKSLQVFQWMGIGCIGTGMGGGLVYQPPKRKNEENKET